MTRPVSSSSLSSSSLSPSPFLSSRKGPRTRLWIWILIGLGLCVLRWFGLATASLPYWTTDKKKTASLRSSNSPDKSSWSWKRKQSVSSTLAEDRRRRRPSNKYSTITTMTTTRSTGDVYVPTMDYQLQSQSKTYYLRSEDGHQTKTALTCSPQQEQHQSIRDDEWNLFHPDPTTSDGVVDTNTSKDTSNESMNGLDSSVSSPSSSRTATTKTTTTKTKPARRRLLIGLTSGYDKYAEMLTLTAHVAELYASYLMNHEEEDYEDIDVTVVVFQGMAIHLRIQLPSESSTSSSSSGTVWCSPPPSYASLNKIRVLFYAMDHAPLEYDFLLLLDADILLVDWEYDITQLLQPIASSSSTSKKDEEQSTFSSLPLLAAPIYFSDKIDENLDTKKETEVPPVSSSTSFTNSTTNDFQVDSRITLWNLHHPEIKSVAISWFQQSKDAAVHGTYQGDQRYLQSALLQSTTTTTTTTKSSDSSRSSTTTSIPPTLLQPIISNSGDAADGHSFFQHFQGRSRLDDWQERYDQLTEAYGQLCEKYDCSLVSQSEYPTVDL